MRLDYKGKYLFAFSDTHGMHRKLSIPKGTDILICAGDVVSDFQKDGLSDFLDWFSSCPAQLRLFVPGNHEIIFDLCPEEARRLIRYYFLCHFQQDDSANAMVRRRMWVAS